MDKQTFLLIEIERGALKGVPLHNRSYASGSHMFMVSEGLPPGHQEVMQSTVGKAQGLTGGAALLFPTASLIKNTMAKQIWDKVSDDSMVQVVLDDHRPKVYNHPAALVVALQGDAPDGALNLVADSLAQIAQNVTTAFYRIIVHDETDKTPFVIERPKSIDDNDLAVLSKLLNQSMDVLEFLKALEAAER